MAEPQATPATSKPITEDRNYEGVLRSLLGKKVSIVNPESYEVAAMGFQLKEGHYNGKITGWGHDYLIVHTAIALSKKEGGQNLVQQYIPIDRIKRISVMKAGIILHL